jgi:hypothetical protein
VSKKRYGTCLDCGSEVGLLPGKKLQTVAHQAPDASSCGPGDVCHLLSSKPKVKTKQKPQMRIRISPWLEKGRTIGTDNWFHVIDPTGAIWSIEWRSGDGAPALAIRLVEGPFGCTGGFLVEPRAANTIRIRPVLQ